MRIRRVEGIAEDTEGCSSVDGFQAVQDRSEIGFVLVLVAAHVIDPKDNNGFDILLTDPLRSRQFWKVESWIEGIRFVEVGVGVGGLRSLGV